jgi:DNA-binding response OmpR family regulator
VRAVLRRAGGSEPASRILTVSDVTLDLDKRQASVAGRSVELTPTEFDLLAALMESPGRVFSRMQLLDKVQGYAYEGYDRTIDAHVKNLRQKLEEDPKHPHYILTVYGVGYKFAELDDA